MDEKLIAVITDYPELYNKSLPSYRDPLVKQRAWRSLSARLGLSELDCRKRWRNLRDVFTRRARADRLRGANGSYLRQWRYSSAMAFLLPFNRPGRTMSGSNSGEEEEEEEEEAARRDEGRGDAAGNSDPRNGSADARLSSDKPKAESPSSDDGHTPGVGWQVPPGVGWQVPPEWQAAGDGENEDEMFFMSLLPHIKRLPYRKKCALKLKFHQLLHEAEFDES